MLPVFKHREAILDSVAKNQVTIIVGETGSGKTTAVPQLLYEAGYGKDGVIGITEPRRIAAISVAKFVASNLSSIVGKTVAHKIRFDDTTAEETKVKFMTDGILLREFHDDPMLSKYSVIMVDEAHERSANIDFLLGLLKGLLKKRPDLKLVVASATIDANKFARYFGGAPVITVSGRLHDVQIIWGETFGSSTREGVVPAIETILRSSSKGDILVFLAGIDDINTVDEDLGKLRGSHDLVVLQAHGSLSPEDQGKVFDTYPGKRKVVLATNIAETSITIDGVVYVVDTGYIKQTNFNPRAGFQSLDVVEHSQAGCAQRSGRAGRTSPGVCYRLYSKDNFDSRPAFTEPEIKRMGLAGVVLAMEALEIPNIKDFDFIDPPDAEMFKEAYETLRVLGAIEDNKPGLTPIGVEMAALPLEPRVSRMVIEAKRMDCVEEVATIAAFMSVGRSPMARPKDKEWEADAAHRRFKNSRSDMLTNLHIWRACVEANFNQNWCFQNFLVAKTLQEVRNVRDQLLRQLARSGVKITKSNDDKAVLRSVAAGLAFNLLKHSSRHEYEGTERSSLYGIYIHPGSSVFGGTGPLFMVTAEIVETSKRFARMCSVVDIAWLPEIAPSSFTLGEVMLKSYMPGEDTLEATKTVSYKNRFGMVQEVGRVSVRVSLSEARDIQARRIREAKQAGWLLLTIEKGLDRYGLTTIVGRSAHGTPFRISSKYYDLEQGAQCYCKPSESTYLQNYVEPQFRIFELPSPTQTPLHNVVTKSGPKADVLASVKASPNDGSLGALLALAALKQAGKR